MNTFDELAASPPAISTTAELLQRLRDRVRPLPAPTLTPDNADEALIKNDARISNEERIAKLRATLSAAHSALLHDHTHARFRGYAKASFENERSFNR